MPHQGSSFLRGVTLVAQGRGSDFLIGIGGCVIECGEESGVNGGIKEGTMMG